ncbi:hypothetical protein GCM10029978_008680 [Actinoallomurus acanthiterrae]
MLPPLPGRRPRTRQERIQESLRVSAGFLTTPEVVREIRTVLRQEREEELTRETLRLFAAPALEAARAREAARRARLIREVNRSFGIFDSEE